MEAAGNKRHALDSSLFPGLKIHDCRTVFLPFGPPNIHTKEHLSPVLGIGSSCTRVDGNNGILLIILAVEHPGKRHLVNRLSHSLNRCRHFPHSRLVILFSRQVQKNCSIFKFMKQLLPSSNDFRQSSSLLQNLLCFFRRIPDAVFGYDSFNLTKSFLFIVYVKDNP